MKHVPETEKQNIKRCLSYDSETGDILCKELYSKHSHMHVVGSVVGSENGSGYRTVGLGGKRYKSHHLAWFLYYGVWPDKLTDHVDGDGLNNKISNLRLCSPTENQMNARTKRNSKSGYKGVSKRSSGWVAEIGGPKTKLYLGFFRCPHEAAQAYNKKAYELFGEFAKPNELRNSL